MLTDSDSLQREIDKVRDRGTWTANHSKEKCSKLGERVTAAGKEPDVGPGIELVLNGEQANVGRQAAVAKLRAIGVSLPTHAAEQIPITQTKRDKIAATTMIWTENEFSRL